MNTKPVSTSNQSVASQRNLEVSPWTQESAEKFESELKTRFEQAMHSSAPPARELLSIQSTGMHGVKSFLTQLRDGAAGVSGKTFVGVDKAWWILNIHQNVPASSMAIVVSGKDVQSPDSINRVLGLLSLSKRSGIPVIGVFEKEDEVPSALMFRANLMVLCDEGADLTQDVPSERFPNRTTYRLSVSDSGEMEVAKQTIRVVPGPVLEEKQPESHLPHITDLLNKRRQASCGPDSDRPSVANPTM